MGVGELLAELEYRFHPFTLSPRRRRLLQNGEIVPLSPRALSILMVLVEHHDRLVAKDEIFGAVWPGLAVEDHTLAVHVSLLRKVLGPDAITTVPGRGYKFAAEVRRAMAPAPDPAEPIALPEPALPRPLGRLIGRDAELSEVAHHLTQSRLTTLTGAGGIGKTRLALELGWRLAGQFRDGVGLVDLAPLTDPAVVVSATATALGVALRSADAPIDALAAAIANQHRLVIFDNCEHLVDAAASLIHGLLERVAGLSVLATSREILHIPAERIYRLVPLALPPREAPVAATGPAALARFGAIALFVARAEANDRHFRLTEENSGDVIEVCRRLDGMPLALEMAAARLPLLGVEGLRARLDERLHMFNAGPRTVESRHRTLRDTVAWSFGLLDAAERQVFRRVAIFPGSFSLDAALAVARDGSTGPWEITDTLGRLIDKSLITVESSERPRYRLLETIRLYGLERLAASGETEMISLRHAEHVTALFDQAYQAWETTPDAAWLQNYAPEIDNVRAALDWCHRDAARFDIAVSLAGSAALYWDSVSLVAEGRHQLDRAAQRVGPHTPPAAAARLLRLTGALWHSSDRSKALAALTQSAALYRALDDRGNLGSVLGMIGSTLAFLGRHEEASAALREAAQLLHGGFRPKSLANVTNNEGLLAMILGAPAEARRRFEQSLALARAGSDAVREIQILVNLAEVEFGLGAVDRAVDRGREAISRLRTVDKKTYLGWASANLASYLIAQNSFDEARQVAAEALSLARPEGGYILRVCLQQWALLGALDGTHATGASLLGFVEAGFTAAGETRQPTEEQLHRRLLTLLEAALPAAELEAALAEGRRWSERQALDMVFATIL